MKLLGLLVIILLILLGLLGSAPFLTQKFPKVKDLTDKLAPYAAPLGVTGIIVAVLYIFPLLDLISIFRFSPGIVLIALLAWIALLGLGIIFGFEAVGDKLFATNSAFRSKGEVLRAKLLPYQVPLGITALVIGIIDLLGVM